MKAEYYRNSHICNLVISIIQYHNDNVIDKYPGTECVNCAAHDPKKTPDATETTDTASQ